jgi:hypothetical protein
MPNPSFDPPVGPGDIYRETAPAGRQDRRNSAVNRRVFDRATGTLPSIREQQQAYAAMDLQPTSDVAERDLIGSWTTAGGSAAEVPDDYEPAAADSSVEDQDGLDMLRQQRGVER